MEETRIEILWQEKSNAPLNIWGLETGNTKLNRTVAVNFIGGNMMYNGHFGPLAQIFMFGMATYIAITFFWSSYPLHSAIFVLLINSYVLYRFILREVKYYQLAKNTVYLITNEEIIIKYSFLGFTKEVRIKLEEISYLHEVEYQYGKDVMGSIWIYHESDVKAYDIVKKERTVLPRIQMVQNHKLVQEILAPFIRKNKRTQ